jgi:hypothetical protein
MSRVEAKKKLCAQIEVLLFPPQHHQMFILVLQVDANSRKKRKFLLLGEANENKNRTGRT